MAEKRMFAKSIVLSDAFLDMPMSARCLYFTLGMLADDEGFVGNPKSIMRQCGASDDDMRVLLSKRYVLGFESGVVVIKHWLINNFLRNDRKHDTTYIEEKGTLIVDEKGAYTERNKVGIPIDNQVVTTLDTEISIDKNRLDKNSIYDGKSMVKNTKKFVPPTLQEVRDYCQERNNNVDYKKFYEYYSIANWKDSKGNPVKNWKQKMIANWEKENKQQSNQKREDILTTYDTSNNPEFDEKKYNEIMARRKK